ncbi:SPOR domain-containing protein [Bartonella sp. B17]
MSDNDRKNPQKIKQENKLYDPVEGLARIFNSNKQSENQNNKFSLQSDSSISQTPETSFQNEDFDLSFLETEIENNLANNLPLDDQSKQWGLYATNDESTVMNIAATNTINRLEQDSFSSKKVRSMPINHDEEQILDTLSPLPIQNNQPPQNKTIPSHIDPFFEKDNFNVQSENFFFDETSTQNNNAAAESHEQAEPFLQIAVPQPNAQNIQQNYGDNQSPYDTSINHSYEISANQKNWSEDYTTDDPQFYEEKFLKQEVNIAKNSEYSNAHTQYINNAENPSYQNNEREVFCNQNNLNNTQVSSEIFNTTQTNNFSADNCTRRDNPPPNVDTYKFAEETVEKTGPIMVPEVPYTAPEYDVPIDNLKEEFADVFNVGNAPKKDFSQQHQQDEILSEIFHQTMQNPEVDIHVSDKERDSDYFSADNRGYYSSSFTENSPYKDENETPTGIQTIPILKTFIRKKIFTKSVIFFILITIGFIGYSRFFTSPQKNEDSLIIRADNTPFKLKPETTETENNLTSNLDVYKQTTGENEKQDTTQQFLIDNSETPEELASLNKQESESVSSSFLDEPDVEGAVTEAINHTIPTREVQTVIVKQDGTIALTPAHDPDKESIDNSEKIDETTIDKHRDESSISPEFSDTNSNEIEHNLTVDADVVDAKTISIPHVKFVPIPSRAKFNSNAQTHISTHSPPSANAITQNTENYYVQVASQPTSALAQDSLQNIKYKFGYLIGTRPLNIQPAFIQGKGTYYRIRIQTQNRNEAINLCEDIKNSGGDCFITR